MSATHNWLTASAVKSRLTRSAGLLVSGAGFVVRGPFARLTPRSPAIRISRSTVHRATSRRPVLPCLQRHPGKPVPRGLFEYLKRGLDELWIEGSRGRPKMMSVGLHPRLVGQAGRANVLREFIEYAQAKGNVWFARRDEIATTWTEQFGWFHHRTPTRSCGLRPNQPGGPQTGTQVPTDRHRALTPSISEISVARCPVDQNGD